MSSQNNAKMKISKTETEYDMKSIKFLQLSILTMFIITSSLMIVLGISVYSRYHSVSFLYESVRSGALFTPSILVVVLGLVSLLVTLLGFFGTLKESTCIVNVYACVLCVVVALELALVCVSFATSAERVARHVAVPAQRYAADPEIQAEMDLLQVTLNCCGDESLRDYIGQAFTDNHTTAVYSYEQDGDYFSVVVPTSCCAQWAGAVCARARARGCRLALVNVVIQNATILGVLGVSVMFVQALGITFSLLLARCIRKWKSERALLKWKACEQIILERQAEDGKKQDPTVFIEHRHSSVA